jgi:hypothetical protein
VFYLTTDTNNLYVGTGAATGASTVLVSGGSSGAFPATVSGTVTSGGVPYFSSTTQESSSAALTANSPVLGGGAGAAPATAAFLTTDGTTQLNIGPADTVNNGVLGLKGKTSGTLTISAPAVAGAAGSQCTISNGVLAPTSGGSAVPAYSFTGNTTTGLGWSGAGIPCMTVGGNETFRFASSLFEVSAAGFGIIWNNSTNFSGSFDVGIFRQGPGVLEISNSSSANALGSLLLTNLTASGTVILGATASPTSAGSAGTAGQFAWDATNLYICTATGGVGAATWKKVVLAAD